MKKLLILMLVLLMTAMLTACAMPATTNPDGSYTVAGTAIVTGLNIVESVAVTILSVAGAAWAAKCKDKAYLQNLNLAVEKVENMAKQTAGELKQLIVDKLKEESTDGKLTPQQIEELKSTLLSVTLKKLDNPTKELLAAAGADICAIIAGAGEDWVRVMNESNSIFLDPVLGVPDVVAANAETVQKNADAIKKAADELLSGKEKPFA